MQESFLRTQFANFLEREKGYPPRSILFEVVVSDQSSPKRIVDLALIDPADKEILAIVEFKTSDSEAVIRKAFRQIAEYKKSPALVNKNVLAFLVLPSADVFSIWKQSFEEGISFNNISSDEFPSFADLSFTAQVQGKIKQESDDTIIVENSIKKTKLFENYTYAAVIGLVTAVLGFYISYNRAESDKETERQLLKTSIMLDSIRNASRALKKPIAYQEKDSINVNGKNTYINKQELESEIYRNVAIRLHNSIEGRLKNIEDMLSKEPEKTLSILEIKSQVSELKSLIENKNTLYDEKIISLKEKADLLSNLTWALALTVLATLVSVVIFYIQAKKA